MITEQIIPHEELLDAVHDAAVEYIDAERALQNYRSAAGPLNVESDAKLKQLKRTVAARAQALRDAQEQLVLTNPAA